MLAQKKTIKVLMFLLPAVVSLIAYTAYHEMLFKKPGCLINCEQSSALSDNEKIKKWLSYLESLRNDTFNSKSNNKSTFPTQLDLAFLENKINLASNNDDFLKRYQQIISDLNSPNVVNSHQLNDGFDNPSNKLAPLTYITNDQNPNNQVFTNFSDDLPGTNPNTPSGLGPSYTATGNSPGFFATGGLPNDGEANPGNNGANGTIPNNGVTPIGPGGNGNSPGGGNSISEVPLPSAGLLVTLLMFVVATIRHEYLQRNNP